MPPCSPYRVFNSRTKQQRRKKQAWKGRAASGSGRGEKKESERRGGEKLLFRTQNGRWRLGVWQGASSWRGGSLQTDIAALMLSVFLMSERGTPLLNFELNAVQRSQVGEALKKTEGKKSQFLPQPVLESCLPQAPHARTHSSAWQLFSKATR